MPLGYYRGYSLANAAVYGHADLPKPQRALYLAWLAAAQFCLDDDDVEPLVPDNLNNLSPSLNALISYFELDVDLVQAAAVSSQKTDTANDDLEQTPVRSFNFDKQS